MRINKQRLLAWLLLTVFVSIIAAQVLHRHEAESEAVACAHHDHETAAVDDCLLCQFFHTLYVNPVQTAFSAFVCMLAAISLWAVPLTPVAVGRLVPARAPPARIRQTAQ